MSAEGTKTSDLKIILDPGQTSPFELEMFFLDLEKNLEFEKVLSIIDNFECTEEYKQNHPRHYEMLLSHAACANIELKTDDSIGKAKKLYKEAIERFPNSDDYSKYVCYGNLVNGFEALDMFFKASGLLLKHVEKQQEQLILEDDNDDCKAELLKFEKLLESVYTAMGEIYITDLLAQDNALGLALEYYAKAFCRNVGETSVDTLLLKFNIHCLQKDNPDLYPRAMRRAKIAMKNITLALLKMPHSEWNGEVVNKSVNAAISIHCYMECSAILSEFEKFAGSNNESLLSLWSKYHHACAAFHLKGFKHYSTRLTEVIAGLEHAHEATDETKETKQWVNDLIGRTHSSIEIVENNDDVESVDDFVEMGCYSVESKTESELVEEVTIIDSGDEDTEYEDSDQDGEGSKIEDDDDSCVIIEDNGIEDVEVESPNKDIYFVEEKRAPAPAPAPAKNIISIDLDNSDVSSVTLSDVVEVEETKGKKGKAVKESKDRVGNGS